MARISEQVLAGLARPTMAQGMFDLGAAIGGVPGQMRQKRRQEEFNEIMKMGQAAMTQNDPVNLSRVAQQLASLGYTKESQQFAQAAQQANLKMQQQERISGLLTQAGSEEGLTREAVQSFVGAGGNLANIPIVRELEKQYDEPLREKGRGRLRAMAQMELFDPQDPGKLQGYKNVAKRHKVSFNEAMQILAEERGTMVERAKIARTGSRAGTTTFASGGKYLDKRNLEYRLTEVRDPTGQGQTRTKYEPVGHEIPYAFSFEDEEGNIVENRLTEKGGAYGETAAQRTERYEAEQEIETQLNITEAVTIEEAKDFNKQKIKAAERLPAVNQGLEKVNAMLQIVDGLNTGSTLAQMSDLVQTALGYRETDRGVFEKLALQLVADNIKTYGSNPSDGERAAVQAMLPSLENTSAINREILEMAQRRFAKERAAINYIQQEGMTLEKYVKFVDSLYPSAEDGVDPATGNQVVDFNDI